MGEPTSTPAEMGTESDQTSPAVLPYLAQPPQALSVGRIQTDENFQGPTVGFQIPAGWFGSESDTGFAIGKGLDAAGEYQAGGVFVDLLGLSASKAAANLLKVHGIHVTSTEPVSFAGANGKRYDVSFSKAQVLLDQAFGIPVDLRRAFSEGPILIEKDGKTFLIRVEHAPGSSATDRAEIDKVFESFSFADS